MSTTDVPDEQAPAPAGPPPRAEVAVPPRPPLGRPADGRMIGGVCVGLATHLGVPVKWVRIGFLATTVPFGAGLVVYVFLWATVRTTSADATALTHGTVLPEGSTRPTARSVKHWMRGGNEAIVVTVIGVMILVVAGMLWLGWSGVGLRPEVLLPLVAIIIGAIFFWSQLDDSDPVGSSRPVRWLWLAVGLALTCFGLVLLLADGTDLTQLWRVAGAVIAALIGVVVLAAPWILRLLSNLRTEQAARIRATERADIAAHLHDSVLQTLALIQRQADDPSTVARLARAQERQLRSYLYDEDARSGTLGAALTNALAEVEDLNGIPVELVVTGDLPMDENLDALVKAVREAAWNAVRHGAPPVTAYVEVSGGTVEAFVRDHGEGFDLDEVPDDRAGVRESIIGRMERHGGRARIRRLAGGTEVELVLPLDPTLTPPPVAAPEEPAQLEKRTS